MNKVPKAEKFSITLFLPIKKKIPWILSPKSFFVSVLVLVVYPLTWLFMT